ncbi:unnamed protein product [Allacma fusca]|uniref:procollagen-proline 4-dioxygenase n=1 Tax=Allacma fusca TaxID=39272 RepID=A0A8J2NS07_9HEXA|nr:unnamed protein product [Allacma fusca]
MATSNRIPNILLILVLSILTPSNVISIRESQPISSQREDLFSSTSKLEDLVESEVQIVDVLDTFADYTLEKAKLIKSYVEAQKTLINTQGKKLVAHPVEAYLLIRRLTADWEDVHGALHAISNYSVGVFNWVETYRQNRNFPQSEDLTGAAHAIVRLQDTYRLNMKSLSEGIIQLPKQMMLHNTVFHGKNGLTAQDLLFIGKHAFTQGLYNRAIQWLQTAEGIAGKEINGTNGSQNELLEELHTSLRSAIEVHDDILERQGPRGITWKTNPVPINPELARDAKYQINRKEMFVPALFRRQSQEEEFVHFERLCAGEEIRPDKILSTLKCRLTTVISPYFVLSPLRVEEASLSPHIVIIHDFVTASQADRLIELGKPKLRASMHQTVNGTFIKSYIRTSKTAWLKDHEDPLVTKITKKIEQAVGLKASLPKEAEDYQIANYGLGGLYVPHTDHLMNNPNPEVYTAWERFVGDRIATMMIYLSNVEAGGATVFPRAGVTLWPKKGAAAFWWNLDRSGVGDENTRHGACPVLYGDKWVSNKWIRLNEQFLSATCGLHPLEKFQIP